MNKELKVIDFYCKKCKKSMKVSYMVTGNRNYPVLPRVMMKCHHCGRVMTLKNFKEGELGSQGEERSQSHPFLPVSARLNVSRPGS